MKHLDGEVKVKRNFHGQCAETKGEMYLSSIYEPH